MAILQTGKTHSRRALFSIAAALSLPLLAVHAHCDPPVTMAPPDQAPTDGTPADGASADSGPDSVFNWTEIPQGQPVQIVRAVFDRGGYQLYDTEGETIVVPFNEKNLYVMKFDRSEEDGFTFVNNGDAPLLHVPADGYLENAAVPGARWYPFSETYHPSEPVFLGVAPSWGEFINMGWYSNEYWRGGYWCQVSDGVFVPMSGLVFVVNDTPHYGWVGYQHYASQHRPQFRVVVVNHNVYHWANRPSTVQRAVWDRRRSNPSPSRRAYADPTHGPSLTHPPHEPRGNYGASLKGPGDQRHSPRVLDGTPQPGSFGGPMVPRTPIDRTHLESPTGIPVLRRHVFRGGGTGDGQPPSQSGPELRRDTPNREPQSPEGGHTSGGRGTEGNLSSPGRSAEDNRTPSGDRPSERPNTFERPRRETPPTNSERPPRENTPRPTPSEPNPQRERNPPKDKDEPKDKKKH